MDALGVECVLRLTFSKRGLPDNFMIYVPLFFLRVRTHCFGRGNSAEEDITAGTALRQFIPECLITSNNGAVADMQSS